MMNLLTRDEVRKIIEADLSTNAEYLRRHNIIGEYLTTKEGKPANGTTFRKLPDNCKLTHKYGMTYIVYNDGTRETQHLVSHGELIGKVDWDEKDAPYGRGAKERIDKLNRFLNDEALLNKVVQFQNNKAVAVNALLQMKNDADINGYQFPAFYEVFRVNEDLKRELKYIF